MIEIVNYCLNSGNPNVTIIVQSSPISLATTLRLTSNLKYFQQYIEQVLLFYVASTW